MVSLYHRTGEKARAFGIFSRTDSERRRNRPNRWLKKLKNGVFDFLFGLCYNKITEGASDIQQPIVKPRGFTP